MLGTLLMGLGAGAGLTWLLDPAQGARRRAVARDRFTHTARVARRGIGAASRDLSNRTRGAVATVQRLREPGDAPDDVLIERVRSKLGRVVSRMHAIGVKADAGVITLEGPILDVEHERAVATAAAVKGVADVVDRLQPHEGSDVPALQGGIPSAGPFGFFRRQRWTPGTRALAGATAAALAAWGVRRRGPFGLGLAAAGAGLGARAFRSRRRH